MSSESKFIPMPEAQTSRLRTTVELPFNNENAIGLNVDRIQALCQLSGFRHLRIQNQEHPLTTNAAVMIVGMDSRGTAVGGKASVKTVPIYEEGMNPVNNVIRKQSRWFDLTISLNQKEIQQRMLVSRKDVRKVTNWAKNINQALTQGIVNAGVKQLLSGLSTVEKTISVILYGLVPVISFIGPEKIPSYLATMVFMYNYLQDYRFGGENFREGSGHRYSLIFGPELDRALVLLLLANSQKLAKPLKK